LITTVGVPLGRGQKFNVIDLGSPRAAVDPDAQTKFIEDLAAAVVQGFGALFARLEEKDAELTELKIVLRPIEPPLTGEQTPAPDAPEPAADKPAAKTKGKH
jgi:hypothetical protein